MDTNIPDFSPALQPDVGVFAQGSAHGEAPDRAPIGRGTASRRTPVSARPARSRRFWRAALLSGAALMVLGAAAGAYLLSPYNTLVAVDAIPYGPRLRQVVASAGIPVALPPSTARPVIAPAAKLAATSRPPPPPVTRWEVTTQTPEERLAELQGFRNGVPGEPANGTARDGGGPAVKGKQPAAAPAGRQQPAAAEPGEAGAPPAPVPPPTVAAAASPPPTPPAPSATPAPSAVAAIAFEPGSPPPPALAALSPVRPSPAAAEPPSGPSSAPADATASGAGPGPAHPAEEGGREAASTPPGRAVQQPAASVATPGPSTPRPAQAVRAPASTPVPTDPVEGATELRASPMGRAEEIKVLNLVAQLGIEIRNMKAENKALRNHVQDRDGKVDEAIADFDRRLALAEARGAMFAAMGGDATPAPAAPTGGLPPATAPAARPTRPGGVQVQSVGVHGAQIPAPQPGTASGPRRWKVQAASPGLAMLSELDRSGGEGSQLQVLVGQEVAGYGKVTAIQQRGAAWIVQTERGPIQ